jgi:hypothetical protein
MNTILASLLLLAALIGFALAVVALIRRTENADADQQSASTIYNLIWASASALAATGMTALFDLRWLWIGLFWCMWLLAGWYIKWFGVSLIGHNVLHRSIGWWDERATHRLQNVPPRRIITRRLLMLSIVWVVASLIFVLITSLEADHEISLMQDGVTIKASLTDYRVSTRSGRYSSGNSYDVRYQFSLDDGAGVYTASDATGRRDLWRSIPRPDYDAAVASGAIEVVYWPRNPWVNRPVHSDSADLPTLVIIDLFCLVSVAIGFSVSRAYVSKRSGPPSNAGTIAPA